MAKTAADGADDVDAGPVGPGGHVGRGPQLRGAWSRRTAATTLNYLVMGPWRHSRVNYDG